MAAEEGLRAAKRARRSAAEAVEEAAITATTGITCREEYVRGDLPKGICLHSVEVWFTDGSCYS